MKTNSSSHLKYWLAAARLPDSYLLSLHRWLETNDIQSLFSANSSELQANGFTSKQQTMLRTVDWLSVAKDMEWCEKNECQIICFHDEHYPRLLREIKSAPLVLLVRGDEKLLTKPQLAIVGSRNPSIMGREIAEHFAYTLAKAGLIITSGLAVGIDAASHLGAISGDGRTLAVLGSGFNSIYPPIHRKLAEKLIADHALVTEFMPNEGPKAKNFPRRNRIISGLCLGVLVIEAALKSGSLVTARLAVEQGREVFAVPGSIFNPLTRGCHQLIRQGAKLVETVEDVLEELGPLCSFLQPANTGLKMADVSKLNVKSKRLLEQMGYEVTPLDAIIIRSGLTASEVSSMLLSLELQGFVQNDKFGYVRRMR